MTPAPTAAVKMLKMPPPAKDNATKNVHAMTEDLFNQNKPAVADIKQGGLANCPLASILAALANTPSGRERIRALVVPKTAVVETDVSDAGELASPPPGNKVLSNRYFVVTLGGKSIEVSDVLYTDDADRNWSPIYMKMPTNALWGPIVEKAYAVKEKSYENLDDTEKLTAQVVWKAVVGKEPKTTEITDDTDLSKIRALAAASGTVPAIGASRDNATKVSNWHGFAILSVEGSTIELYDPMKAKKLKISLKDFRSSFKAILSGSP
jgi:hypothetical protein